MIYYIKMDGKFTRNSRLVSDGHTTSTLLFITYSIFVYRDRAGVAIVHAFLNDLDIFACNIGNSYINSNCRDKIWTDAGTEFVT